MATETELKLRLLDPGQASGLADHPLLADAGGGATERLVATYYDTPLGELAESGVALRVRWEGGRLLQTVKTANEGEGGLHRRQEWEVEIEDNGQENAPDLRRLPDVLRERLDEGLLHRIIPRFTTDFRRTKWILPLNPGEDGGGYVEVCLDQGEVRNGERALPIHEIELEIKGNEDTAYLYELAQELQRTLSLVMEDVSKAQRGYGLG